MRAVFLHANKVKELVSAHKNDEAIAVLDNFKTIIEVYAEMKAKSSSRRSATMHSRLSSPFDKRQLERS